MSLISVLQYLNGAQFLNATCVATISGCFTFFFNSRISIRISRSSSCNSNISCDGKYTHQNNHKDLILLTWLKTFLDLCVNNYSLIHCHYCTIFLFEILDIHSHNCLTNLQFFVFQFYKMFTKF